MPDGLASFPGLVHITSDQTPWTQKKHENELLTDVHVSLYLPQHVLIYSLNVEHSLVLYRPLKF